MRRISRVVGILAFFACVLLILLVVPSGESYEGVDVDTCGTRDQPCHGEVHTGVTVIVDGPDVVETNTPVTYVITVIGGPSKTYGYFVVFTDPDGTSMDFQGNLLFEVEPNSVTRVGESNTFLVEFTPPRYAVDLTMRVSAVSADDSGSPYGDGWNYAEKEVRVEYPISLEFPGLDISSSAYLLGLSVMIFAFVLWIVFFVADRKVKKEVASSGRERES